jgi:S1-C subfamily serine protease
VLAAAVLASGLIGGVVGHELDSGTGSTAALAPLPAAGGSSVALPAGSLAELYKRMLPTVVEIEAVGQGSDSTGSGVIVDSGGTIVTAAHVVGDKDTVTVILSDGRQFDASVVGRDTVGDLAVLKLKDVPSGLTAAPLGDSSQLAVGQTTAALGAPFGLQNTFTVGVISGLNRTFSPNPSGPPLRGLIQTDAAINPGSSGGPLFDGSGRVIGINTAIKSPVGGSVGVGFAVPVNQVRESLPLLVQGKTVERPFLGIEGRGNGKGVEVARVTDGSSASGGGVEAGDVITSIAGRKVLTIDDIAAELDQHKVGDRVDVTVIRGGAEKTLSLQLKPLPT